MDKKPILQYQTIDQPERLKQPVLQYRTVDQRERLKPFLFWMILMAAVLVVVAVAIKILRTPHVI